MIYDGRLLFVYSIVYCIELLTTEVFLYGGNIWQRFQVAIICGISLTSIYKISCSNSSIIHIYNNSEQLIKAKFDGGHMYN